MPTPIFIDVGKKTFNLCYQQLEKTLEDNKNKLDIKAVIAVDLFGLPANYKKLKAISKKYNIKIIADAAQSFGASVHDKRVGSSCFFNVHFFFSGKTSGLLSVMVGLFLQITKHFKRQVSQS